MFRYGSVKRSDTMARDVVLYVEQPGSMEGTQTEEFLRERGVNFTIRNIADGDEEAVADLERMGTSTTPVTVAGDEVIVGFDRERLEKLVKG
jgi:glutaredoxin